jgi:hypothetical protein
MGMALDGVAGEDPLDGYFYEGIETDTDSPPTGWIEVDNSGGTDDVWNCSTGDCPIHGSYSYNSPDPVTGINQVAYNLGSGYDEIWWAFKFHYSDALSGNMNIFKASDTGGYASGDLVLAVELSSGGAVSIDNSEGGFSDSSAAATTLTAGNTYYIKIRLKNGATLAEAEVWVASDTTSWGTGVSSTDGEIADQIQYVHWFNNYFRDGGFVVDNIIIDNEDIPITYFVEQVEPDPAKVAEWTFENHLSDTSDNSNTLQDVDNAHTFENVAPINGSYSLEVQNATDNAVYRADASLSDDFPGKGGTSNDTFTICVREKADRVNVEQFIYSKFNTGDNERTYGLSISSTGYPTTHWGHTGGASGEEIEHGSTLTLGVTYGHCVSYDGDTRAYRHRIWDYNADDALGTDKTGTVTNEISIDTSDFYVGCREWTGTAVQKEYVGLIDDVTVYNYVLTPTQMDAYFDLVAIPDYTESHYVTQAGAGSHNGSVGNEWSISEFENSAQWDTANSADDKIGPGDIVYFSGALTSDIDLNGSFANGLITAPVVLDGTSASYTNFPTSTLTYSYDVDGIILLKDTDYITVQNWTFDGDMSSLSDSREQGCLGITSTDNGETGRAHNIIFDNNSCSEVDSGVVIHGHVEYVTITNNYFEELHGDGIQITRENRDYRPNNITIGGSLGNGNEFYNVSYNDNASNVDGILTPTQCHDIVYSYNYAHNDIPGSPSGAGGYGQSTIYANEVQNILVEYNITDGMSARHMRSFITVKDDWPAGPTSNDNLIVRFNHVKNCCWSYYIHPNTDTNYENWGTYRPVIFIAPQNAARDHTYIYGNFFQDIGCAVIITGYGDSNHLYIFSNLIEDTQFGGFVTYGSTDGMDDIWIFNNTLYNISDHDDTKLSGYDSQASDYDDLHYTAVFEFDVGGSRFDRFNVYNNLLVNWRMNDTDSGDDWYRPTRVGDFGTAIDDLYIDYNHYYKSATTARFMYATWNGSGWDYDYYDYDNSSRPGTDGDNSSDGDPNFSDAANSDFRLSATTPADIKTGGKDIEADIDPNSDGYINCITIAGTQHCIPANFILGDNTVFHATEPDSIVIDAQTHETDWSKGAYED